MIEASWVQLLYLGTLSAAYLLSLGAVLYVWQRRSAPASSYLIAIQLATAHIAWCFLMLSISHNPAAAFFWAKLRFLGLTFLGPLLLLYALAITGNTLFASRWRVLALFLLPLLIQGAIWSSPPDGGFFRGWQLVRLSWISVEQSHFVGWYWVHIGYNYFLLFIAQARLVFAAWQSAPPYRQQLLFTFLAVNVGYVATIPGTYYRDSLFLNPTPIGMSLMGVLVVWALARYGLLGMLTLPSSMILAGIAEAIVVLNPRQHILQVNPAAADLLGHPQPALVGKPLLDCFPAPPQALSDLLTQGSGTMEVVLHPSGQPRPYDLFLSPLTSPQRVPLGYLLTMRDATARREAERAVRESEALYRSIIAAMAEGIVVQGEDGAIRATNASAERILGLRVDDLTGRTSLDPGWQAIHPDGSPFPGESHPAMITLRTGMPQQNVVMGLHKPDGSRSWISINTQPLQQPDAPAPYGVVASFTDITSARQTQEALRESEERLRSTVASLDDLVFVLDEAGRFVDFYQPSRASALYRLPSAFLGRSYQEVLPPPLVQQMDKAVSALLTTGEVQQFDYALPRGDQEAWFNAKLSMRRTPDGAFAGTTAVVRDISARKRAEQAMLDFQTHLKALQALSLELARQPSALAIRERALAWGRKELGFGSLALALTVAPSSDSAPTPLLNIPPSCWDDLLAFPYRACLWDQKDGAYWGAAAALWDGDELFGCVVTDNALDGRSPRPYELELLALFGQSVGHMLSLHAASQQLAQEADLLTTLINAIPDQIFIKDTRGRYLKVNRAFAHYRGFDEPSLLAGLGDHDFYAPALAQQIVEEDRAIIASGKAVMHREIQTLTRDNRAEWWEVAKLPLFAADGSVRAIVGVLHNITEAKQIQDDLRQAREQAEAATLAKSRFLANMSHELRTPLNGILGMVALLLDTPLSTTQQDFARTIRQSGETLLGLISDILDFSALETTDLVVGHHPFDLFPCLEAALERVCTQASAKGVGLVYHVAAGVPASIVGDEARLRQVLVNLLSNAVKFTTQGEVILTVDARPAAPAEPAGALALELTVEDSGIGIPPERLATLFEPFNQADTSLTRRHGGTGLGLAITHQLVERMGGSLEVESEVGRGSLFRVRLPVAAADRPLPPHLLPTQPALAGRPLLLIGGSPRQRAALRAMAERWGVQVAEASDGAAGIAALRGARPPAIALVDSLIAGEVEQRLAGAEPPLCPLVLLTTRERRPLELPRPFSALLFKAVTPASLHQTLLTHLAEGAKASPAPVARLGEQHPLRVLLAEDNETNQKLALLTLARLGYRADAVTNGREALAAVTRQPYDVVLMDVQMPEMDGLSATRAIRAQVVPARQPTIIALTAHASAEDQEACLDAGMDDYLSKPLSMDALVAALRRVAPRPPEGAMPATLDDAALAQLRAMLGEEAPALLPELIRTFGEDGARLLATARSAHAQGAHADLRRAAHSLRSAGLSFGATELAQLASDLEQLAQRGDEANRAVPLLAALEVEWERAKAALALYQEKRHE